MSVNKVILVGNVGKDPETRYLDEATAITKFSMATSETYKNKAGERISNTEWHNIVLWRGLAQVAEKYVKKGTQIYIEGRIKTRSYDDQEGNKKYITEIVGDQMQLLSRKPDESGEQGGSQGGQSYQGGSQGSSQGGSQGGQATPQQAAPQQAAPQQATPQQGAPQQGAPQNNAPSGGNTAPGSGEGDSFDNGDNGPDDLPF
jgi:single-strand DNA-binding protein